jgi:hypothetical protein
METNDESVSKMERPGLEKKLGDIKVKSKEYEQAAHHFMNAIYGLKMLFDEEGLLNETKATELIEDIGVR